MTKYKITLNCEHSDRTITLLCYGNDWNDAKWYAEAVKHQLETVNHSSVEYRIDEVQEI